jgi:hypothetical protein
MAGLAVLKIMYASSKSSAVRQCEQEANSFESQSARCSLATLIYAAIPRLQRQQYSSFSCSRLTLPSRGRFPACGLQAPLMSNVSRLSAPSRAIDTMYVLTYAIGQ